MDFDVQLRKNLIYPNLTVLTHLPDHCPGADESFEAILIDYVVFVGGRLLMVREVPALNCSGTGRKYILEETLDKVERLLELEQQQQVQPSEILNVPVYHLRDAA
jgi:hypothetical protein